MTQKQKIITIGGVLIVSMLAVGLYLKFRSAPIDHETYVGQQAFRAGPCPGEPIEFESKDSSMPKTAPVGSKLKILPNYYSCHPLKRGEKVWYRFASLEQAVIRRVVGVEGDEFYLKFDDSKKAWTLVVNSKVIFDHSDKMPFYFGNENQPVLSIYQEKETKKVLQKGHALVLAEESFSGKDSSSFGVISVDDLIGKVDLPEAQNAADTPSATQATE